MENTSEEIEIDITCISKCEVMKFIGEKDEEEVFVMFYKTYDHSKSNWKDRLKDAWKALRGKPILGYDMVIKKTDLSKLQILQVQEEPIMESPEPTPKMRKIPDYADLMTIDEWIENVKCGGFIYSDGDGYYATSKEQSDIEISFSEDKEDYDPRFTHVAWYNK